MEIFLVPKILEIIAGLALLVALLLWRYQYPEEYKRAKKKAVNFLCTAHHVFYFLASMVSLSALGFVAVYFYSEKTVEAIRMAAPDLYGFVASYILTVQVAFLIFISLFFLWKTMTHYHNSLDNGIIDDPDVERRFTKTDIIMDQMERNHHKDMLQMQKAIDTITQMQQAFYETGNRFMKDPLPPEGIDERRTIVRPDPSVPVTKEEVIAAVLPEQEGEKEVVLPSETITVPSDPEEAEIISEPIPEQIDLSKKKDEPKLSWKRTSDWDEIIANKFRRKK